MVDLRNDYSTIAHENILKALYEAKNTQYSGYGLDMASKNAEKHIKKLLNRQDVDVHFLINGTGTNKTVISHILAPHQAVVSCDSGHINVHETGAIEGGGHKVLPCLCENGILNVRNVHEVVSKHNDEHMVQPKLVYVSNSSETGMIYTYDNLLQLRKYCDEHSLYLYMDGARLASAMASQENDVKWEQLCDLFDAFYIGGTKNGALMGEAVVIVNNDLKRDFRYSIKHFGSMYAKGFVAGIQFFELFCDYNNPLYMQIGREANAKAEVLVAAVLSAGLELVYPWQTNQLFLKVSKEKEEVLRKHILFERIEDLHTHFIIRFVTSYDTKKEDLDIVKDILRKL